MSDFTHLTFVFPVFIDFTAWGKGLFVFLYLGPETIMPLASILATIVGGILVFWRFIVGGIKKIYRKIRRIPEEPSDEEMNASDGEEPITGS